MERKQYRMISTCYSQENDMQQTTKRRDFKAVNDDAAETIAQHIYEEDKSIHLYVLKVKVDNTWKTLPGY